MPIYVLLRSIPFTRQTKSFDICNVNVFDWVLTVDN